MNETIALAIIVKDEVDYLADWINYHLALGFNKIFLGINDVEGPSKYPFLVKYEDYLKIFDLSHQEGIQKEFYNSIIDNEEYEWCAFIDTDEFITLKPDSGYKNIREFLNDNKNNATAFKMNWELYGDDEKMYYENKPVYERFTKILPYIYNSYKFPEQFHTKSLLSKYEKHHFVTNPHTVMGGQYWLPNGEKTDSSPFNSHIEKSIVYIRHYYTKTIEEWFKYKYNRSYADYARTPYIEYYPFTKFFLYNNITEGKLNFLKMHGINYSE